MSYEVTNWTSGYDKAPSVAGSVLTPAGGPRQISSCSEVSEVFVESAQGARAHGAGCGGAEGAQTAGADGVGGAVEEVGGGDGMAAGVGKIARMQLGHREIGENNDSGAAGGGR